jgi:hypothetical protein
MSAHAAGVEAPVSSIRRPELSATGLQGRRARRGSDLRNELRAELRYAFTRKAARHRSTFIPLTARTD